MRPGQKNDELPCTSRPDLWFSELRRDKREAKRACKTCPVAQKCLELSLTDDRVEPAGIWGGLDHDEREELVRRRTRSGLVTAGSAAA